MRIRAILILWAVVAGVSAFTTWLVLTRQTAPKTALPVARSPAPILVEQSASPGQPVIPPRAPQQPGTNSTPPIPDREITVRNQPADRREPVVPGEPLPNSQFDDPVYKEQLGRYALSYVGADPLADEVWATLIYDTSLSDKVREDLMEDLNENGFSAGNGRIPTVDDIPLIESRLALLEETPIADEFMLEHLGEAYKDLMNMWVRLSRQ